LKPIDWQLDPLVNAAQQKGFNVTSTAIAPTSGLKRDAAEVEEDLSAEEVEEVQKDEKKAKP
jgi:hypothetical protein